MDFVHDDILEPAKEFAAFQRRQQQGEGFRRGDENMWRLRKVLPVPGGGVAERTAADRRRFQTLVRGSGFEAKQRFLKIAMDVIVRFSAEKYTGCGRRCR